jgi:hypothetical protein
MDDPIDPALQEHYALGKERDRLGSPSGVL